MSRLELIAQQACSREASRMLRSAVCRTSWVEWMAWLASEPSPRASAISASSKVRSRSVS